MALTSRGSWLAGLLLAALLTPSTFTVAEVDRAVRTLDLEAEARVLLAATGYTAAVTVESSGTRFGSSISSYETLPLTGVGGRQGPSFDARTGIPWWF